MLRILNFMVRNVAQLKILQKKSFSLVKCVLKIKKLIIKSIFFYIGGGRKYWELPKNCLNKYHRAKKSHLLNYVMKKSERASIKTFALITIRFSRRVRRIKKKNPFFFLRPRTQIMDKWSKFVRFYALNLSGTFGIAN